MMSHIVTIKTQIVVKASDNGRSSRGKSNSHKHQRRTAKIEKNEKNNCDTKREKCDAIINRNRARNQPNKNMVNIATRMDKQNQRIQVAVRDLDVQLIYRE